MNNKRGFTLVELIVVIAILALVMVIVATKGFGAFDSAKNKIASINEETIKEAAEVVRLDIEYCDDSNDELLDMFGVNNCNDLYYELEIGLIITLDEMLEKEYVSGGGIEEISNKYIYKIKYKKEVNDITVSILKDAKVILLGRNSSSSSETYYAYKNDIVEVNFVDYVDIDGKTNWDVTDTSASLSGVKVYAWLENAESGYYKLYFGSEGKIYAPKNLSYFFRGFSKVKSISFNNFDTSIVENMQLMFWGCTDLENLNLSSFNTNNVKSMYGMFAYCTNLQNLTFGDFDTSKLERMDRMFIHCENLETLDLSNFDTTNVTTMDSMFLWCTKLSYLNLSSFITNSSTEISTMLLETSNLSDICIDSNKSIEIYDLATSQGFNIACH